MAYDDTYRGGNLARRPEMSEGRARVLAARSSAGWEKAVEKVNASETGVIRQMGKVPDTVDMLPEEARAYLVALREEADDLQSAYWHLNEPWRDAMTESQKAANRVRALTDPDQEARTGQHRVGEDHPALIDARAKLVAAKAELEKLTSRREALGHRSQLARRLVTRTEEYLNGAWSGLTFEPFTGKLKKFASVDAARAELDKLNAALSAAWTAPWPSSAAKAKIRAEIANLAARGKPGITTVVNHGDDVRWPTQQVKMQVLQPELVGALGAGKTADALGLICWAIGDQIAKALDKEIDAASNDQIALTDEQRNATLTSLADEILDAERAEVALVAAAGMDHRDTVDVRALLGIVGPAAE
ncbi:hypothetical protein EOB59_29960 [Mesorhizobium sp. M7A.F.Ca.MR.176.00.0.0]|uniref:hypothetical protein n=1 Tax=Mesorhizobium sp. M7A.F.Ca.MR.176.00.0.0 TaxID=2496776 RepID=UPI000FD32693|nr:hypothetical protein [Mesorhizobium sp. M7A.F.Ca.MR.176.00.0.0]RUU86109.1 hypothetical protein EOB59_29960 [Mesorhizobium sp. M7A.F.Ca.MR.176.00.0.0]